MIPLPALLRPMCPPLAGLRAQRCTGCCTTAASPQRTWCTTRRVSRARSVARGLRRPGLDWSVAGPTRPLDWQQPPGAVVEQAGGSWCLSAVALDLLAAILQHPPRPALCAVQVGHGEFVTEWAALPLISGIAAGDEADLPPHAADLVRVVSGRAQVAYSRAE